MLKLLLKSMKVKDQKTKMKLEYVIAPPETYCLERRYDDQCLKRKIFNQFEKI